MEFYYLTGERICAGDAVLAGGKQAIVESVLLKNTNDARNFSCYETGGVLLAFQDGDLQLWPYINEDLELIRGNTGLSSR